MSKLSKNILGKIKKENVTPKSRAYFTLMYTLLWVAVVSSIILGGLATAVVIRHLALTNWQLAKLVRPNPVQRFVVLLPYLWLLFIGVVIFVADKLFQHTKKGYKIKPLYIALGSILLSIILGASFFFIKLDQPFEHAIRQNLKPYEQWENKRAGRFVAPERGILAAKIIEMKNNDWQVIDFKGDHWKVDVASAVFHNHLSPTVEEKVIIKGELVKEGFFKAVNISSWEDARTLMERRERQMREDRQNLSPEEMRGLKNIKIRTKE